MYLNKDQPTLTKAQNPVDGKSMVVSLGGIFATISRPIGKPETRRYTRGIRSQIARQNDQSGSAADVAGVGDECVEFHLMARGSKVNGEAKRERVEYNARV